MRQSCCTSCFSVREAHDVVKLAQSKLIVFSRTIKRTKSNFWLRLLLETNRLPCSLGEKTLFLPYKRKYRCFLYMWLQNCEFFPKIGGKNKKKTTKSNIPSVFAECFHNVPMWTGIPHFFQQSNQNISKMEKFFFNSKRNICCLVLTTVFVPRAKNQNPIHIKWESVQLVPALSKL